MSSYMSAQLFLMGLNRPWSYQGHPSPGGTPLYDLYEDLPLDWYVLTAVGIDVYLQRIDIY